MPYGDGQKYLMLMIASVDVMARFAEGELRADKQVKYVRTLCRVQFWCVGTPRSYISASVLFGMLFRIRNHEQVTSMVVFRECTSCLPNTRPT